MMDKGQIIDAFQCRKMNVEIVENKNGQVVVSKMCQLYQQQVFSTVEPWDEQIERGMKEAVNQVVKPGLRKLIVHAQTKGQPIKPILTLAGPLPKLQSFTFDLVFMMRLEKMNEAILTDTFSLINEIDGFLSMIKPTSGCWQLVREI